MRAMISSSDITAVILAGGAGSRLGGVDKGWLNVGSSSFIERLLVSLAGQVGSVVISANRHQDRYATLGPVVVADSPDACGGPLAGVFSCWPHVNTRYMLLLPVDAAIVPPSLVGVLADKLGADDADIARVRVGRDLHPTCALIDRIRVQAPVQGGGSLMGWQQAYRCVDVAVDRCAVLSVNTPEELSALGGLAR